MDLARKAGMPLDEARALAGQARCARAEGDLAAAADLLRRAAEILSRIGATEAAGVTAELAELAGLSGRA
jgi:hypothetical protein